MNKKVMTEDTKSSLEKLKDRLIKIYLRKTPPKTAPYLKLLDDINSILLGEDKTIRPYNDMNIPGGIIYLKRDIPTIIVPDIHARIDFFINIMFHKINGLAIIDRLANNSIQVVCVGDAFHAESRAYDRWQAAFEEFQDDYESHENIDNEMRESLGAMEMVIEVKKAFKNNFHFLKGNHENIANENGDGNFPFRKFAYEGPMVLSYIEKFYGEEFLSAFYIYEKNLPLFVIGRNFLISHAEPEHFFEKKEIINYRDNPEVVQGLTWTDNNQAKKNSVAKMLDAYLDEGAASGNYYFGGHRPVKNLYDSRAAGHYIQIHNPGKFIIGHIKETGPINLDRDIIELKDRTREIINTFSS